MNCRTMLTCLVACSVALASACKKNETPAPDAPAADTPAPDAPAADTPAPDAPAADTPAPDAPAPVTPPGLKVTKCVTTPLGGNLVFFEGAREGTVLMRVLTVQGGAAKEIHARRLTPLELPFEGLVEVRHHFEPQPVLCSKVPTEYLAADACMLHGSMPPPQIDGRQFQSAWITGTYPPGHARLDGGYGHVGSSRSMPVTLQDGDEVVVFLFGRARDVERPFPPESMSLQEITKLSAEHDGWFYVVTLAWCESDTHPQSAH